MKSRGILLVLVVPVLAALVSACIPTSQLITSQIPVDATRRALRAVLPSATETPTPIPPTLTMTPTRTPRPGRILGRVLRAWDGNTILIEGGYSVRYIGVDAPGAGMFRRPVEPFGREAADRNVELVEGADVELEDDVTDVDASGNLLRYVYVDDIMVNELLLREGLARLAPVGRNGRYTSLLEVAQEDARNSPVNIWTLVTSTPTPTREPPNTLAPSVTPLPSRTPLPLPPGLPRTNVNLAPPPPPTPRPTSTPFGVRTPTTTSTPSAGITLVPSIGAIGATSSVTATPTRPPQ